MANYILGRDIVIGTRIKTWFMPGGTSALAVETHNGPISKLFPNGAKIVTFIAATRSGSLKMTVDNAGRYEI